MTMTEVSDASNIIASAADPDASAFNNRLLVIFKHFAQIRKIELIGRIRCCFDSGCGRVSISIKIQIQIDFLSFGTIRYRLLGGRCIIAFDDFLPEVYYRKQPAKPAGDGQQTE